MAEKTPATLYESKTANFTYELISKDELRTRLARYSTADAVDNWDFGRHPNSKTNRASFSFFMPSDSGSQLVAQLLSYEWKGNVLVDYIQEVKYVDDSSLIPTKRVTLNDIVAKMSEMN